jgi:hypothetical protein
MKSILKGSVSVFIAAVFMIGGGFYVHSAQASTGDAALGVTQITAIANSSGTVGYATADNKYADGWRWDFYVTVPNGQTLLKMKFADWISGSNIIPAGGNIQIYSAESTNAIDEAHAIPITASSTWSDILNLNPNVDEDVTMGGRQIDIIVEAKIPTGFAGGSYSTSYGINTLATSTVTLSNLLQTYDSTGKSVTVTTDPVGLSTSVTYDGSLTPPTHAGTYTVVATVTDPNYIGSTTDTLVIKPAPITAIANLQTKAYDGNTATDPALTYATSSPLFGSDTFTGSLSRDPGENVGLYNITQGNLALDGDYVLTFDPNQFTITTASATITLGDLEQTYDSTGKSVTVTTDPAGLSTSVTYDSSSELPVNAGTYPVIATITDPNYTGATSTNLVINKAPVTFTTTGHDKVYDGTTSATADLTVNGAAGSDVLTANGTAAFQSKNVGNDKAVNITGITLSGDNTSDYAFTDSTTTTANITPASLTISATGINKVYDGTTDATVNLSSNKIGSDDVTVAYDAAAFGTKDVATGKTVSVTGITIGDTDAGNYSLSNTTATTNADITAKNLTISGLTIDSKSYDGNTTATLGGDPTLNSVISPDAVTLDGSSVTANFVDSIVGSGKSVALTGLYTLGGDDAVDYTLTQPSGLTGDITQASATVTLDNLNQTYGSVTPVVVTTVPSGLSTSVTYGGSSELPVNAGTYTVVATITDPNYTGSASGNLVIHPVSLTVTAVTDSKVYDGTASSTGTPTITSANHLVGNDFATWKQRFDTKDVGIGNKTLIPSGAVSDGNDGNNYYVTFVNDTTGSITPLPVTVSATGHDKVYDGTIAATVDLNVTGAVGGDTLTATGIASFASPDASTTVNQVVSVNGITLSGAHADDYAPNTTATTNAYITPKPLTLVVNTIPNMFYNGTNEWAYFSGTNLVPFQLDLKISGAVGNDDITQISTINGHFSDKKVGNNKLITFTGIKLDGVANINDYTYNSTATTTGNIQSVSLVASITANSKVYDGTTDASATCSLVGIIGSDSVTCVVAHASFDNKNIGPGKTVTATGLSLSGTDAGNYSLSNTTATTHADISKLAITVTAQTNTKAYDGNTSAAAIPTIIPPLALTDSTGFIETYDNADSGSGKTLTPSGVVIDDNGGANYSYHYVTDTTGVIIDQDLIPNGSIDGNTFNLTGTASSGLIPVTFGGGTPGVCTVDSNGLVTILDIGTCPVTAQQLGDPNHNPSPVVNQDLQISFSVASPAVLSSDPLSASVSAVSAYAVQPIK